MYRKENTHIHIHLTLKEKKNWNDSSETYKKWLSIGKQGGNKKDEDENKKFPHILSHLASPFELCILHIQG